MKRQAIIAIVGGATVAACALQPRVGADALARAAQAIDADGLLARTRVLASDEFEGRAPGTPGEDRTVAWLQQQFSELGLAPGNPDGRYVQDVPLVGISARRSASLTAGGKRMHMNFPADYVAVSRRFQPRVEVKDSELVFVGYGVVAPEYGWDDYKDVDVRGKTIVMLVNDPQVPDANDPSRLDDAVFRGRAMTYYGRWTYKYEIAAEKGAAAALVVHETGPAGYPFAVLQNGAAHESFEIDVPDGNAGRAAVEAWITEERARTLFRLSGMDFDRMKQAALSRDFRPVALPAKASFRIDQTLRRIKSRNVVAKLPGSDPALADQYVVYTAHWDHLGRDRSLKGDQIFNGALDNASGTAGLVELAEAASKLQPRPRRSLLFLAVTAEEQGLLGSKWYAENPLYPLTHTVANINMDGLNHWGRTGDMVFVGKGQSTLEDVLTAVLGAQGRQAVAEPTPEKGFYFRSDHFEFARVGVPALYADGGVQVVGKPEGWGQQQQDAYIANDYHKVSDEVRDDWNMEGAAEDLRALLAVGVAVADAPEMPEWKQGSEFRARREAMLREAGLE